MRFMGLSVERLKTRKVGSFDSAIIDLQERVNILEHNRKVVKKEAKQEEVIQSEIDSILSRGAGIRPGDKPEGLWSTLHPGGG